MKTPITVALVACCLSLPIFFSGCNTPTTEQGYKLARAGESTTTIRVPSGLSDDAIEAAITDSLIRRSWIISERGKRIVAHLTNRSIRGQLTITYDDNSIQITSESTDIEGKPFFPIRWINFLRTDIEASLAAASASTR